MVVWLRLQRTSSRRTPRPYLSFGRFFPYGYCAIYHGLFVVDVLVFAVGYGVEHPWLGNEIRSVEPTLLGWLAALLCYPPLVWLTSNALGWFSLSFRNSGRRRSRSRRPSPCSWESVCTPGRRSRWDCEPATSRTGGSSPPALTAWYAPPGLRAKNVSWWIGAIPLVIRFGAPILGAWSP